MMERLGMRFCKENKICRADELGLWIGEFG
jgi:hypothetical protein